MIEKKFRNEFEFIVRGPVGKKTNFSEEKV
jgi:hypothetical protein